MRAALGSSGRDVTDQPPAAGCYKAKRRNTWHGNMLRGLLRIIGCWDLLRALVYHRFFGGVLDADLSWPD